MRAEAVYIVEPFLIVYILPSLSVTPVPFLVMVGVDVVVVTGPPKPSSAYRG